MDRGCADIHEGMEMVSVRDLDTALVDADCVVIATDHSAYDWGKIAGVASMVMDARRVVYLRRYANFYQ